MIIGHRYRILATPEAIPEIIGEVGVAIQPAGRVHWMGSGLLRLESRVQLTEDTYVEHVWVANDMVEPVDEGG